MSELDRAFVSVKSSSFRGTWTGYYPVEKLVNDTCGSKSKMIKKSPYSEGPPVICLGKLSAIQTRFRAGKCCLLLPLPVCFALRSYPLVNLSRPHLVAIATHFAALLPFE